MLNTERFFRTLVLASLFSFFLWSFSYLILILLTSFTSLLVDTFLNAFISIIDLLVRTIFTIVRYISKIFFIGCMVGLISIFVNDFIIQPMKSELKG